MRAEEGLKWSCSCLECGLLFAYVTSCGLSFVKCCLGRLEGTEGLEESKKILACPCCEAVKGMTDQVGMRVLVNEKANCKSFRRSTVVYVRNVRDTTTDGEMGYDWRGCLIEVTCYGGRLGLLCRCEGSFDKETFRVCFERWVTNES